MSEANKNLAKEWFEQVWNQKSEAAIDRLFAPQCQCYGFPEADGVLVGPEAFKAVHRTFLGAFPDIHVEVEDVIAEGDHVAVRWKATMTHLGDHLGFPASGRQAELGGSSFLIGNGKQIIAGWNYMDIPTLFQKLQTRPE
jgi:steroid delta-isomerase-like uncharacterized protein